MCSKFYILSHQYIDVHEFIAAKNINGGEESLIPVLSARFLSIAYFPVFITLFETRQANIKVLVCFLKGFEK